MKKEQAIVCFKQFIEGIDNFYSLLSSKGMDLRDFMEVMEV